MNDFSSEDHTIISTVTYDGSVKMAAPNTNRTDSKEDRAEQVPLQHGGQDTELSDQRLSSDNRTMLLYSNQQRIEKQVK